MSEKMLVTQALDERDLLVKKISDKIDKASFVDTIKPNEDKVYSKRIGKDEYAKEAESAYQQIVDLIERFQKIDAAIVASNAETEITTSYGKFTVAGAISLRSRLRGLGTYDGEADFEGILKSKMQDEYNERVRTCDLKNSQLQNTAESMRLSILGKDSKTKDDKPLGVVDAYVKENTTELVDPLDIKKKIESLEEKNNTLLKELDTQIKVSIDSILIKMAQLNRRKTVLDVMRKRLPKSREEQRSYMSRNSVPEYRYINYDLELVKNEYELVSKSIMEMQMALDKYNQTVQFEVDI